MKKFDQFIAEIFDFQQESTNAAWGGFGGGTPPPSDAVVTPTDETPKVNDPDTIEEDGEGMPAGNTTAGIQNYQSPIGSNQPTAKKKDDSDPNATKIATVTSRGP